MGWFDPDPSPADFGFTVRSVNAKLPRSFFADRNWLRAPKRLVAISDIDYVCQNWLDKAVLKGPSAIKCGGKGYLYIHRDGRTYLCGGTHTLIKAHLLGQSSLTCHILTHPDRS